MTLASPGCYFHIDSLKSFSKNSKLLWNPESTLERKKNTEENDFPMFGFTVLNKRKSNIIKIPKFFTYFLILLVFI